MKTNRDELEDFIGRNRSAFEESFDSEQSWKSIAKSIAPKEKRKFNWLAAASIVLLIATGWLLLERYTLSQKVSELENLTVDGRSYQKIEEYYMQTIAVKTELVEEKASEMNYPIDEELDALQRNYNELKQQLRQKVPHQKIVDAMIWNLRTQIEILNEQMKILEEIKNYTNKKQLNNNEKEI